MDKDVVGYLLSEEPVKDTLSECKSETLSNVSEPLKRKAESVCEFDEIKKRALKTSATNGFRLDENQEIEAEEISFRDELLEKMQNAAGTFQKHQVEPPSDPRDIHMQQILQRKKKVIKMKSHLPNLALPEGWIAINHRSGGILYLHRSSRVVTWSRPYHIGGASVRKHDVPIAAIPCLHQLKGLLPDVPSQQLHHLEGDKTKQDDDAVQEGIHDKNLPSKKGTTILNLLNTVGTTDNDETDRETLPTEHHDADKTEPSLKISSSNSENVLDHGLDVAQRVEAAISGNDNTSNSVRSITNDDCGEVTQKDHNVCDHLNICCDSTRDSKSSEHVKGVGKGKKPFMHDLSITNSSQCLNLTTELKNIKTQTSSQALELIDYEELENYLSRLWEFQELTEEQEQNILKGHVQPTETESEELQLQPLLDSLPYSIKGVDLSKPQGKEWFMNPSGKTPVAILHEYSQQVLKLKPEYKCYEGDSSSAPFVAEVVIEGITYGKEQASSKKQAKHSAAEATLEILTPGLLNKIRDYQISQEELKTFDKIKIENPNVYHLCMKTGLPLPSKILDECLKRNQGVCPNNTDFEITPRPGTNQKHSYKMTCGKHTATGFCKNKKIGKQLAAQKILQKLHPKLEHWGSILRMYCDRPTVESYKKEKEDSSLNTAGIPSGAKPDLLLQLKNEMRKLCAAKKQANQKESESEAVAYGDVITVDI